MDNIGITSKIKNLYENKGFFITYGADLILSIIIIYIFLSLSLYYYILGNLPKFRKEWPLIRCNPLYIPFASLILKDTNLPAFEVISKNFEDCTSNITTVLAEDAFAPIHYLNSITNSILKELSEAINNVRHMFSNIRGDVGNIGKGISSSTLNATIPLAKQTIIGQDTFSKTHGAVTAGTNEVFGLFMTVFSFFKFLIEAVIGGLILMVVMIAVLWIGAFFTGPQLAIAATINFGIILTAFVLVILLVSNIFNYKPKKDKLKKLKLKK